MKLKTSLLVASILLPSITMAASDLERVVWIEQPDTEATIAWRQTSGENPRVEFGQGQSPENWLTQAVEQVTTMSHPDDGDVTLETHIARLSGLSPNTDYSYRICDSEGCGDSSWFKTAPNSPTEFTYVAGGDSRTNREPRQMGNKLVSQIRPLFVLFNGDFTDDGNHEQWVAWLEDWQLTRSEDGRVYPIIASHGNHENDVIDMLSYVFGVPETSYYVANIGGSMMDIFSLNSELEPGVGYGAYSDQDATAWEAQNQKFVADAKASVADWKLANYHRPMRPHTSGKTEGEGRIAAWAPTFTETNFKILVESDTHMSKYTYPVVYSQAEGSYQDFKRDDVNGTMIIGEGSWGAPTRPTDDDKPWTIDSGSFWQFKLVHASPDAMKIHTVRFGSEHETLRGVKTDISTVGTLTQADQDANPFAVPANLPLWQPLAGSSITMTLDGFKGAEINSVQLVGSKAEWAYLDDGSSADGWNTLDFDDASWAKGNAQLGYGDGDEVTEISFGSDEKNKHPTTYFRKSFNLDDPSKVIKLTLRLLRDDGAVVYINGQEVVRSNMPDGDITPTTFAGSGIGGGAESTFYEYALFADALQAGKNVVAVEVHQSDAGSSDLSFDMDLTAVVSTTDKALADATTELTAKALSVSEIQLNWSDDEAFDEVGYQLERKVGNGAWEILTWRLEANETAYLDKKLVEGATYTYRVRPYNAAGLGNVSNELSIATLSNPTPKLYEETFESGGWGELTMFNKASNADWVVVERAEAFYAQNNGYGADTASDDWIITPAFALNYYADAQLAFESAYNYGGPLINVLYSNDYDPAVNEDPTTAQWTAIAECKAVDNVQPCWNEPSTGSYVFEASEVDISSIKGDNVRFAFQYVSTGTGGGDGRYWQLDNIVVRGLYNAPALVGDALDAGIPADWSAVSVASDKDWAPGTRAEQAGIFANGFGGDAASEDWLILPTVSLSEDDNAAFEFDFYQKYGGPELQVMVSTDYDGDAANATWSDLNVDFPVLDDTWMTMGPISLKGYTGNVTLAFLYTTSGTGGGEGAYYGVANAFVKAHLKGVFQQRVVWTEGFEDVSTFGTFSAYSRASNADWVVEERADNLGAVANGFGADAKSDDWLISPQFHILDWQNAQFSFDVYTKYGGPALELYISNDYSGEGDPLDANWTQIEFDQSQEVSDAWNHYQVDVSGYTGAAHVAFRYLTNGTGGGEGRRLGVDNPTLISTYGEETLKANFSIATTTVTTIQPVSFEANVKGGEAPYTINWNLGDGQVANGDAVEHTYSKAGNYTVTLSVADANGNSVEQARESYVNVLQSTDIGVPSYAGDVRVATFNAYLNRSSEGQILADAQSGEDAQIKNVAEIIQRVRPHVVLLQEFDYVADGSAVKALQENYLSNGLNGAEGIDYPYVYLAESNTGIITPFDFNKDGKSGQYGDDAYGFGMFYGQYGMVLLSQYPIDYDNARTFQKFLWKDMPDAKLPVNPETGESWYTEEELAVFRLSSKSHWDIPVKVGKHTLHVLASHPTPPVFDGDEDRNGKRNHDETRFWRDYVEPARSAYIYDDNGTKGGMKGDRHHFVVMGDLNASPVEGDATDNPIGLLTASEKVMSDVRPTSPGGVDNDPNNENAAAHTADWKMRADYVLPGTWGNKVEQSGVYWPGIADVNYRLVGPGVQSSDHRLVWVDLSFTQ
ncbi:choice-of-anchor J domain-containing protein [Reinekea forsetii]|nr:choice-of-anchor J domain-containing protein [Reinekea forsetii]